MCKYLTGTESTGQLCVTHSYKSAGCDTSNAIFSDLFYAETFYRVVVSHLCVIVVIEVLQRVHTNNEVVMTRLSDFGPRMCVYVCNGLYFLLPDAVVRFATETRVEYNILWTFNSLVLGHPAVVRSFKVD